MVYRLPSYPYDGEMLHRWLQELYEPGQVVNTLDLLNNLNSHIYRSFKYDFRDALGVQMPNETLTLGSGTCRDFAVFMMEAAEYWGFGARFVTGYIQMAEGQHGATHAWTEIYIPGAGWRGFDPTNDKLVGSEHIPVGVSREQEKASPLSGSWEGPSDAFERMTVSVQVVEATWRRPISAAGPPTSIEANWPVDVEMSGNGVNERLFRAVHRVSAYPLTAAE